MNNMNDPLNYTEDELKALSTEDLELLIKTAKAKEALFDTEQLALKIMMNALYGAMANKYFPLFNEQMAAAITGNGRYFIQKLAKYIEKTLQGLHKSEKPYLIYGDTDSCVGSTLIKTENGNIQIQDLYDNLQGKIEIRGSENFVKHINSENSEIKAASVSLNKKLEYNKITYIMKHKVKKRMFKIKCNGDEVTITEDHSMMVLRNNELIEVKPTEVKPQDKLIKIVN